MPADDPIGWLKKQRGANTLKHRDLAHQGENRRWRAVSTPAFWGHIAEMQGRLGWPASGIESLDDLEQWFVDLVDPWDGLEVVQPNPIFGEIERLCEAVPPLIPNIDCHFVMFIAEMGLDAALECLPELVAGNPSARRYRVVDDNGVLRQEAVEYIQRPTRGKLPLDPRLAVKVARLKQQGKTLVEIAQEYGVTVYRNRSGSASAPLLSTYLKRGREILDRYDAHSRPHLRVPSLEDCLKHGWVRPAPNC